MKFESAIHYGVDERPGDATSRVLLQPNDDRRRFKFGEGRDEVAGEKLLLIDIAHEIAVIIEKGGSLAEIIQVLEPDQFKAKTRAYLGVTVAGRGLRLVPVPEDKIITEYDAQPHEVPAEREMNFEGRGNPAGVLEAEFIEV
jgi:hypothetical protein